MKIELTAADKRTLLKALQVGYIDTDEPQQAKLFAKIQPQINISILPKEKGISYEEVEHPE